MLTLQHVLVSIVRNGEQMRGHLVSSFAAVFFHNAFGVNWQPSVGVDSNTEKTRVCLERTENKFC